MSITTSIPTAVLAATATYDLVPGGPAMTATSTVTSTALATVIARNGTRIPGRPRPTTGGAR